MPDYVYVVMLELEYEGGMLQGVFSSQKLAIRYVETQYGISRTGWAGNEDHFYNSSKGYGEEYAIYKKQVDSEAI